MKTKPRHKETPLDAMQRLMVEKKELQAEIEHLKNLCEYANNEIKDQRKDIERLEALLEK